MKDVYVVAFSSSLAIFELETSVKIDDQNRSVICTSRIHDLGACLFTGYGAHFVSISDHVSLRR